ncbi:hypothetical protein [Azospirillum endophyticum]
MLLVILGLLLWSGAAAAACPHGLPDAPAATVSTPTHSATPQRVSHAATADKMVADRMGHNRQMPGRSHHGVQPCCAGMACAAMPVGLPATAMMSPLGSARLRLGWPAGPLHEGLGLRPALPPPRQG